MSRAARFLAILAISAATVLPARATVVAAPTFDELVRDARQIVVAETVSQRASWRSSAQGRYIETTVTFRVDAVVKGAFVRETSLSFLGGQIGDTRLDVSDQVAFARGDRDVLFVSGRDEVSPLVGFNHGRFRIGAGEVVLTHEGRAVGIDVRRESARLLEAPFTQAVTLNEFLAHIRSTAAATGVDLR